MQNKKNIGRIRKFRDRYLSGKAAVLFVVNQKLKGFFGEENNFGKLTDLTLSRREKTMSMEVSDGLEVTSITLRRYGFTKRRGEPYLVWQTIDFDGPGKERYRKIFARQEGLRLSKGLFSLVEAVL